MENKTLLHACCAVCSGRPISMLENAVLDFDSSQKRGFARSDELANAPFSSKSAVVYFYNPNIFPAQEYQRRLEAQRILCKHFECELIGEEYEPAQFTTAAAGLENEPEKGARCDKCFELRLEKTALKAKELGIKQFSTTLGISPHKDSEKIAAIGRKIAAKHGLQYLDIDFQDGFRKTNQIAKELGLYRQNYCGCKQSYCNKLKSSV